MISGIMQLRQAETALHAQIMVLKKSMDVQRNIGKMLAGLIETASPQMMQSSDKVPGLGDIIDLFA